MYRVVPTLVTALLLFSCSSTSRIPPENEKAIPDKDASGIDGSGVFRIAFGSCNRTELPNLLWDDILDARPDLWIWGGDIIYADTDDADAIRAMYEDQMEIPEYKALVAEVPVIGTWDDHDYGLNDGGVEFEAKAASQQALLDFLGVPGEHARRQREGVYAAHSYTFGKHTAKVLVLDTRYFRSPLRKDSTGVKRYLPHQQAGGTVLGGKQWQWLERELRSSKADFNIIVSSIQLLSGEHGFESWGLFPAQTQKLLDLIADSGASGVMVLSGDRHISEFSRLESAGLRDPLVDFTSSGLTHAYRDFSGEPNPYRVGEVIAVESFGLLLLDGDNKQAVFQIRGDSGEVLAELRQDY